MNANQPVIGYLGVGLMGQPMVKRLLAAGYSVLVWNRTKAKLDSVVQLGAVAADTPADLANRCELILMCLTDARAVEAVLFGDDGIAQRSDSSKAMVLVDFSTIHPDRCRELGARLQKASAIDWVDAPVSGGVPGATNGTLAIMAGGEAEIVEQVRPVVTHLSARFTRMGPLGAGQATKLCNQIISGCTMAIVAEAVNFAQKSGADAGALTEALKGGFADSIPFQLFAPRMAARQFEPPLGTSDTMLKDLLAVADVAGECGAKLAMTEQALAILQNTQQHGDGDKDISAIVDFYNR